MELPADRIANESEDTQPHDASALWRWKLKGTLISTAIVLLGTVGTLGLCILTLIVIATFTE